MREQYGTIIINTDGSISIDFKSGAHIQNKNPEEIKTFLEIEIDRLNKDFKNIK